MCAANAQGGKTHSELTHCYSFRVEGGKASPPVKHPLIQTTAEQSSSKKQFPAKNTVLKTITYSFYLYRPLFFWFNLPTDYPLG